MNPVNIMETRIILKWYMMQYIRVPSVFILEAWELFSIVNVMHQEYMYVYSDYCYIIS